MRAFSLVELLVVVAIIALLAALLFPVLAQAREESRSAPCRSQLRQIHSAVVLYQNAHDDVMPSRWSQTLSIPQRGLARCPIQTPLVNSSASADLGAPVTYSALFTEPRFFIEEIEQADANPGWVVCPLHGSHRASPDAREPMEARTPELLRLTRDGAVKSVPAPFLYTPPSRQGSISFRPVWTWFTFARCPDRYCEPLATPCPLR